MHCEWWGIGKRADVKILQDISLGSGSADLGDRGVQVGLRDAAGTLGEVRVLLSPELGKDERAFSTHWCGTGEKLSSLYSRRTLFPEL